MTQADQIAHALREIALAYAAHEPMNPTTPKWIALSKLLPAATPEPLQLSIPIEMNDQPANEIEQARRDAALANARANELEMQVRNLTRQIAAQSPNAQK